MNLLSALAHNDVIYRDAESKLNALIRSVNSSGGKIWIQDKNDTEKYVVLDGEINIGSYQCMSKGV